MLEIIPILAACFQLYIGLRILVFTTKHQIKPIYSLAAVVVTGGAFISATSILIGGELVTIAELACSLFLAIQVMAAQGNVSEIFRNIKQRIISNYGRDFK